MLPIVTLYMALAFYISGDDWMNFAKNFVVYFFGGLVFVWNTSEYLYHRFYLH